MTVDVESKLLSPNHEQTFVLYWYPVPAIIRKKEDGKNQCSGSMTFWCGSRSKSADPCLWIMDPDPAIFYIDLQDANKKLIKKKSFSAYYFLKVHLHFFSKIKSQKEVTKQYGRNQDFSYYFCSMIEGSRSGSIPLTNGSGWRKNMRIRWIWIRNTGKNELICDRTTSWLVRYLGWRSAQDKIQLVFSSVLFGIRQSFPTCDHKGDTINQPLSFSVLEPDL